MNFPKGQTRTLMDSKGNKVGEFPSTGLESEDMRIADRLLNAAGCVTPQLTAGARIYKQAKCFAAVALDLRNKISIHGPQAGRYAQLLIVNAAFAIELYLKALCAKAGLPQRGHELLKLYDALPSDATACISKTSSTLIEKYKIERELRACLEGLNNAFQEWRYSYEYDHEPMIVYPSEAIFLIETLDKSFDSF